MPKEVKFNVVVLKEINAYADENNNITICTRLLNLVEKDEELTGIMSHKIGHIIKSHYYKQTFFNLALSLLNSKIKNDKVTVGAQIV